ncbi:MAG: Acetophenone carboxylase gamma subunit [Gemmatimonadaceae bacterium]|nr:Acetophenone carboxylase gamma subunit [Gemmatimonadaceae bacterium]
MIRAGFDVGGTFTDFVLEDEAGRWHTGKRLTTYPDPSEACLEGLRELLAKAGVSLAEVESTVHGTTLGSNIVIERRAHGVGLITTAGFRDVLQIGREKRYQVYDLQIAKPEPLIDRSMIWEVRERVLADGSVLVGLDDEETRATLRDIARKGVTSLAVCLLHSYINPEHERRIAELAREVAPEMVVSISSEVSPQFREYERTSTTVVNAYVITAVREYLRKMSGELARGGYRGRLFIMQSGGGVATAEAMWNLPVRMIESGPAAGALIAARFGVASGHTNVVAFDMGGTTAKLSMIVDGEPASVGQFELHRVKLAAGSGIPMNVRSLDLVEIGAGGGSIARVSQGTIRVGPESAGSAPGPACYGRGGTAATVTDANLVLGYFNPARFAGGTMTLDVEAARVAIGRVAEPLGLTIEEAAWGIHSLVTLNMELATRVVSIERGNDPRELALVATGGSGPAHACRMALALGMRSVLVPAAAGVASAVGLLSADVKFDTSRSFVSRLDTMSPDRLTRMFAEMEAEAVHVVGKSSAGSNLRLVREADLRYVGQGFELTVPLAAGTLTSDAIGEARRAFDEVYARRYGCAHPDKPVEATTWKVTAHGDSRPLRLPEIASAPNGEPARSARSREAYFPESGGYVETPVYDREALLANHLIRGPAIIEERESTTVIPPGMAAVIDRHGTARVEVER